VNKSVISVHSGSHAWPVKFDNVNIAFSFKRKKKERGEREEDEKRDAAAHTPLTAVPWKERWRDGRRNENVHKNVNGSNSKHRVMINAHSLHVWAKH